MNLTLPVTFFFSGLPTRISPAGLFILMILLPVRMFAQDIHFAQYMYSALNQNPANTGMFDGDYRFAASHREQWNSVSVPYKTFSAAFDMNIEKLNFGQNKINAGLLLNSDKAGDSEFGTLDGELSLAWFRPAGTGSRHIFSAGLQAGAIQRSIRYNKLTFDNQFNGDVFDPSLSPGENFEISRFYYFTLNAGVAWQYRVNSKTSIGTSFGLQHLNKPKQSFFKEKTVRLPLRLQANMHAAISLSDDISLLPDVAFMKQGTFTEWLGGAQVKFNLSTKPGKQYALYLGMEGRIRDALIPMVGLDYNALHLGISYDINTSGLKRASNGRGGLELALVYIIKKVKNPGIKPPCVIY